MRFLIAIITMLLITQGALADSWAFPAERTTKEYQFGKVRIELVRDARKNRQWPLFELIIYRGDELQAKYRNIGFQEIFASEDNKFFLGVSNTGIPGTAFVIFDSDGRLLREVKHRYLEYDIGDQSPTLFKEWYDDESPEVNFVDESGWLREVYIDTKNITYRGSIPVVRVDLLNHERTGPHARELNRRRLENAMRAFGGKDCLPPPAAAEDSEESPGNDS